MIGIYRVFFVYNRFRSRQLLCGRKVGGCSFLRRMPGIFIKVYVLCFWPVHGEVSARMLLEIFSEEIGQRSAERLLCFIYEVLG